MLYESDSKLAKIAVDLLQYTGTKGGIEAYIRALYSSKPFRNSGHEFIGFASKELIRNHESLWFPGTLVDSGISGEHRLNWALGEMFGISKFAKKNGADLIHCPAMLGPVRSSIPTVLTIHDLSYFSHPELMKNKFYTLPVKWIEKRASRNAKRIISISQTTAKYISKYLPAEAPKVDVVLSAGRELGLVSVPSGERHPDVFLAMGQRSPYKSLETAVVAWSLIPENTRPKLIITGSHGDDPLRPLVEKLGVENQVELKTWISDSELNQLFLSSTALLETTIAAGFGMPALEAMQLGLPVLAADIEVFREIAGDSALYFLPANPEDLATKVMNVVNNPPIAQELSLSGLRREKQYSWEKCGVETLAVFEKVLATPTDK